MEKKKKFRHITQIKIVLMLIILLVFNTYAWFIYITTVRTGIELRVKKWDITYEGENVVDDTYITVTVDEAFPGMPDTTETVIVHNNGEISADISYEVVSIRAFDTTYSTISGDPKYTKEELANIIETEIPFDIAITVNNGASETVEPESDGTIDVKISWSFEADSSATAAEKAAKNAKDTEYGTKAYEWAQSNTSAPVEVVLKLVAEQLEEYEN